MTKKKRPSFQFYHQDFLHGTRHMTAAEVGGYIRLLCEQWDKDGLPNDDKLWSKIAGVKPKLIQSLKTKFVLHDNQRWYNQRLFQIKQELEQYVVSSSISGKNGAAKRWNKDGVPMGTPSKKNRVPIATPLVKNGSLSLSSSSNINTDGYVDFIKKFNAITQRNFKGSQKIQSAFNARLKDGFTLEGILKAVANCHADPFHVQNPNYLTPEFILRHDKLEKYLNYVSPKVIIPQRETDAQRSERLGRENIGIR